MLSQYIGGGSLVRLPVTVRSTTGRPAITVPLVVRSGIFSSDLGVGQGPVGSRYRGTIVIPRWSERLIAALRAEGEPIVYRPGLLSHYLLDDVFEAVRQQDEILWRYGENGTGERTSLHTALEAFEEMNLLCLGLKTVVHREIAERELRANVDRALDALGLKPRNVDKREAIEYLAHLTTLLDRRGRPNPSAKAAQSLAGKRRVSARRETVDTIEPIIAYRRAVLQNLLDHLTFTFEGVHHFLETLFLKDVELGQVNDGVRLQRVIGRLEQFIVDLMRIDVRPFVLTADHLRWEFARAISALHARNIGGAKTILRRSWQSLKLRRARLALEGIRTDVAKDATTVTKGKRTLPVAQRSAYAERIKSLRSDLRLVDEAGFRRPVVGDATLALEVAERLIRIPNFMAPHLKEVKAYLKVAAQCI